MAQQTIKAMTLDRSLYKRYHEGKITLHEAAREFHAHGWTNFVDEGYTIRTLNRLALGF